MQEDLNRPHQTGSPAPTGSRSLPDLDESHYRPMLAHMELTDEQASELLGTLWQIMCGFVLLGFGEQSIQKILPAIFEDFSRSSEDALDCDHSKNNKDDKEVLHGATQNKSN